MATIEESAIDWVTNAPPPAFITETGKYAQVGDTIIVHQGKQITVSYNEFVLPDGTPGWIAMARWDDAGTPKRFAIGYGDTRPWYNKVLIEESE